MKHPENQQLKCQSPENLHGKVFVELDPEQFCNQPMVVKLGIQDIQPFSVMVSWQARNHSGLFGYQLAYYAVDNLAEVSLINSFELVYPTWDKIYFIAEKKRHVSSVS